MVKVLVFLYILCLKNIRKKPSHTFFVTEAASVFSGVCFSLGRMSSSRPNPEAAGVSRVGGGVPRGELRPGRGGGQQKVRREVSSSRFPRFPLAVRAVPPAPDLAFTASRLRDVIATARGRRSLRSFGSGPRSRPHVVPRRGAARLGRAAVSLPGIESPTRALRPFPPPSSWGGGFFLEARLSRTSAQCCVARRRLSGNVFEISYRDSAAPSRGVWFLSKFHFFLLLKVFALINTCHCCHRSSNERVLPQPGA